MKLTVTKSETRPGYYSIWYPDGDHCADVRGNLGLDPPIDAENIAGLFAQMPSIVQALAQSEMARRGVKGK